MTSKCSCKQLNKKGGDFADFRAQFPIVMSFSEAGHTVCITIIIFLSETNLAYKFNLHCCCVVHKQKYMHGVQQISSDVQCTRVIIPSGINYSGII